MKSLDWCKWVVSLPAAFALAAVVCLGGCTSGPRMLPTVEQKAIDRQWVEYPAGFELKPWIVNLTAPTAMVFDDDGSIIIAESGGRSDEPHIFGYRPDGTSFEVYPTGRKFPFGKTGFRIFGPIGGLAVNHGHIYVSHRDGNDRGVITAFTYAGKATTIIGDLPAEGDYGMTDLAIAPSGRLYFGVGAATNSGVVGVDNWAMGWVKLHPRFCDQPWLDLKLLGYRFDSPNPAAYLFSGAGIAVTAPFQPFGTSTQTWSRRPHTGKATGAIYSVAAMGGDVRVEAHGLRNPCGLAFNEFGRLYVTNQGMELRGTRPVKDDPDVLLRVVPGTWYGWPDYSADLQPITEERFQPAADLLVKSGYPELSFLIDHATSGLLKPDRNTLLAGVFSPLSGAAKLDFVPSSGSFKELHGSAIVALHGDRAPFATGGQAVVSPAGYKLMCVDVDTRQVREFVVNTQNLPISRLPQNNEGMERPVDVKFGPDGAMYILDYGQAEYRLDGKEEVVPRTGRIFRLGPIPGMP